MKSPITTILILFFLIGLGSCLDKSKKKQDDPVPAVENTFKGCRLIKEIMVTGSQVGYYGEYIYDSNNNIIRENAGFNSSIASSTHYNYDRQGRIISIENYDNSYSVCSYNNSNLLISTKKYNDKTLTQSLREVKYSYDYSGRADSVWYFRFNNSTNKMELETLNTFKYHTNGNLSEKAYIGVEPNGSISTTNIYVVRYTLYDNFKNPKAMPSFTLKQLRPENQLTLNNCINCGDTYSYRSDSLIHERIDNMNNKWEYIYECK